MNFYYKIKKIWSFAKFSKNSIFKFLIDFSQDGSTDNIYKKRFEILYHLYKDTEKTRNKYKIAKYTVTTISRTIFFEDNINSLWARLFADEPSLFEKNYCPTPNCQNNNIKNVATFPINYITITQRGFTSLEKSLDYHPVM